MQEDDWLLTDDRLTSHEVLYRAEGADIIQYVNDKIKCEPEKLLTRMEQLQQILRFDLSFISYYGTLHCSLMVNP